MLPSAIERPVPMREPCEKWGHVARQYGYNGAQALLGVCTCGTFEACVGCGEPHVYVDRCVVCASRAALNGSVDGSKP